MSEISVVVTGSTSISSTVGNGDSVSINVGDQTIGGGNGAAATIQVGTVTTLGATASATVVNAGTSYAAKLNFGLPRGATGNTGPANSLSIGSVTTGATAAVSISGTAPSQSLSFVLQPGPTGQTGQTGPANSLSIASVTGGTAAAVSISGTAPSQTLSFVLPQGPAGATNSLSVGSVTTGATAAVSISGSAPSQTLSFVLQPGPTGPYTTLQIGAVTSVSSTSNAAITTSSSGSTTTLNFAIPRGADGAVNLGDETPQPLGVATPGTALSAARADHVHAASSISYSSLSGIPATFTPSAHTHAVADVTGLQAALNDKQAIGAYATLVGGTVPSSQLPSYVDDVVDVGSTLPATGDVGKIYVVSTGASINKIYRWSGSAFIEISPSPGSTDSVTEGSVNLYYTDARAVSALSSALAGKAAVSHTHTASQITNFSSEVAKIGNVVSVNGQTGVVTVSAGNSITGDLNVSGGIQVGSTAISDGLRYVDINNAGAGTNSGSIMRLVTNNVAGSGNSSVDFVKYRNGAFVLHNAETDAASSISLMTSNAERLRITSAGAVTIPGTLSVAGNAVVVTNDARLSDARQPLSHTHTLSALTQSGAANGQAAVWNGSAWAPATISAGGTAAVTSVSGRTGAVTIVPSDVVGLTAVANVISVQGRTGTVTVTAADLTAVTSVTTGATSATAVVNMVALSAAAYSALGTKVANTLYIVSG
jgi:hypothetical protein